MKRILAILVPPIGMLAAGRPGQAVLCLILMLTIIGWPIAALWAFLVVGDANADARTDRLARAMRGE